MLNSIVGPAVKGVADFTSPKADKKSTGSDSFGKVLEDKVSSSPPKERDEVEPRKAADPPQAVKEYGKNRESERKKPGDQKATAKNSEPEKKEAKAKGQSQSEREQAILKFMDSFESEFGVPPTRIVEAMANLKLDEQVQSPEETADQVIGQLDLDDQDKDAAKNMYVGLLAQLGQMQQPSPPVVKPDLSLLGGSQSRFAEGLEQRGVLNKSLQSMNDKFWMTGGPAAQFGSQVGIADTQAPIMDPSELSTLEQRIQAAPEFKIDPTKLSPEMQRALQGVKDANPNASPEVALAALVAAARANAAKAAGIEPKAADSEDESGIAPTQEFGKKDASSAMQNANGGNGEAVVGLEGESLSRQKGFQSSQQGAGQQESGMTAKTAKGEIAAKEKSAKTLDFDSLLKPDGLAVPTPLKDLGAPVAAASGAMVAGAASGAPTKGAETPADIRQIMNQAQYLIKKGGGEMKVEMTPEGMGKIHMKVLVEGGKVNVQMSAETNEAKKAIEGGLSELKNSLAAHHLSMDHIKVDVVSGTNTENTAQNQMNQNQGSRDHTRQFWNNFNDNFGSPSQQRENFTDIPSLRGYPRARTDKPLEPVRSARASSYGAEGKGKGLNLVA